jgi:hypothetical protein
VARKQTQTKPVIDAVNDAISALTDLVRSVRGQRGRATDLKSRATAAGREVKQGARDVRGDVRQAGRHLKARFERAWQALTSNGTPAQGAKNRSAASRGGRGARGNARRATARARG